MNLKCQGVYSFLSDCKKKPEINVVIGSCEPHSVSSGFGCWYPLMYLYPRLFTNLLCLHDQTLFLLKAQAKHLCKICGYFCIIFNINPMLATQRSQFFFFFQYSQNMFHFLACWQKMLRIFYYQILKLFTTQQSLLITFFIHFPS